jgi:predicted metalloendopeptidase
VRLAASSGRTASGRPGRPRRGPRRHGPRGRSRDDFFAHANGGWLKRTEIPPDRAGYGAGSELVDLTRNRIAELVQSAGALAPPPGSDARKIGDYYASFMDEATIESLGLRPVQPKLDRIAAIADREALSRALGATLRADVDAFNATNFYTDNVLGLWVAQDLDEASRYSAFLLQGGLDMPDRVYYVDESPRMAEIRKRCEAHIAAVLALAQTGDAPAKAARVFELERKIALAHASREESEDVKKGNNHWTRKDFGARAPGMDWDAFFAAAGPSGRADFVVWQPGAVTGIAALVASEPLDTWKDYLRFHALDHAAGVLPDAFGQEAFAFHGTVLSGTPQRRDRWKRAVDATSRW